MHKSALFLMVLALLCVCVFFYGNTAVAGPRFTDNGDGTITDHTFGLMWAKADNQADIGWKQAEGWVQKKFGKTLKSKYDNWRLPTIEELTSLYLTRKKYKGYITDCGLLVKIVPEIKISCILLWSSETALGSHLAFNFNIGDSFAVPNYDISGCRALAVRSLK